MKAIVLHQPWAQFVALGWKRLETRSWATNYRGPLAICAAKTTAHIGEAVALAGRANKPGYALPHPEGLTKAGWPLGAVVAVANLTRCMEAAGANWAREETILGDLTPGRFAWALEDVRALPNPVHVRGRQGLWTLDEGARRAVATQLDLMARGLLR